MVIKKMLCLMMVVALAVSGISGCSKKTVCDWCKEEKVCKERSFLGEKVNVCDDCMEGL